jgi:hypothetical protein
VLSDFFSDFVHEVKLSAKNRARVLLSRNL